MMSFAPTQLTDQFWVSPQITVQDVSYIFAQGITRLVCNRPDGEESGQVSYHEISELAQSKGMDVHYLPVSPAGFDAEIITSLGKILDQKTAKTLAYCRSGTRSTYLWALAHAGKERAEVLIQIAGRAGYDIRQIAPFLQQAEQKL